jgi:hypothetical protein
MMKRSRKREKRRTRVGARAQREPARAGARNRPVVPTCDPRCERYAACQPAAPGWIPKKQAAANMGSTPSALRQRAARVGYLSPALHAMPRSDQPRLCFRAAYFALQARVRRRAGGSRAGEQ